MRFVNREALALSAVNPRHAVISTDGKYLIVAVYGGGAYNVLRIEPDGRIGPVTDIRKELGCGPNRKRQSSAHPHTVAFDASGHYLFGTDLGADRISVFRLHDGKLRRIAEVSVPPGSGPGKMLVHRTVPVLSVFHELSGSIANYEWQPVEKTLHEIQLRPEYHFRSGMQPQFESAAAVAHRDTVYAIGADRENVTRHDAGYEGLPPTRPRIVARVPNATAFALRLVS
jgi:6-phosphogluconolactonase (cycloisomerase 2 family)